MSSLKIYVDGASRGNPGKSGIGIVISDGEDRTVKRISEYIGITTNNVAEYTALIYALQSALIMKAKEVVVFTDSELVARQFCGEYMVRNEDLKRLSKQVKHLCSGFEKVDVRFIGREKNSSADVLANQAIEDVS